MGLTVGETDGKIVLRVDVRKNRDAAQLHQMLCAWQEQSAKLNAGEISREDYDRWRYRYPEFDTSQIRTKVPSQEFMDGIASDLM